ncbi:MAG: hypothetical protein JRE40_02385 [Deltaproteobacteria bacterium]|nr:hypothetical protein [Deltaproteobacteria bacterium]
MIQRDPMKHLRAAQRQIAKAYDALENPDHCHMAQTDGPETITFRGVTYCKQGVMDLMLHLGSVLQRKVRFIYDPRRDKPWHIQDEWGNYSHAYDEAKTLWDALAMAVWRMEPTVPKTETWSLCPTCARRNVDCPLGPVNAIGHCVEYKQCGRASDKRGDTTKGGQGP